VLCESAYKLAPLRKPTNDAKDMAAKLKGMGFPLPTIANEISVRAIVRHSMNILKEE